MIEAVPFENNDTKFEYPTLKALNVITPNVSNPSLCNRGNSCQNAIKQLWAAIQTQHPHHHQRKKQPPASRGQIR